MSIHLTLWFCIGGEEEAEGGGGAEEQPGGGAHHCGRTAQVRVKDSRVGRSVVNPNTLNLDPNPGLCYRSLEERKNFNNF